MNPMRSCLIITYLLILLVTAANGSGMDFRQGKSVEIQENRIIISTSFVDNIINNPTVEEWSTNYFELIYLICIEHKKAMMAGFYLLSSEKINVNASLSESLNYDLADQLFATHTFWNELGKLGKDRIKAILSYYENNKPYASGDRYAKEKSRILSE